jgi:hypothetical protein
LNKPSNDPRMPVIGNLSLKECEKVFVRFVECRFYPHEPICSLAYSFNGKRDDDLNVTYTRYISHKPSKWAVRLKYLLSASGEGWDVEARYKVSLSTAYKMRAPRIRNGKFSLSEITLTNGTEQRFLDLKALLDTIEFIPKEKKVDEQQDEFEAWRASLLAKGYKQGPRFSSYDELSEWDRTNKLEHVRRRTSFGFEVFFSGT